METWEKPSLLEFWLPADPGAVPKARHEAMQACTKAGLTEDDCFALDLAVGEALANAVMHGAPVSPKEKAKDSHVCVSLWHYHGCLIIQVCDKGPGFTPPLPPYRMPSAVWETTHGRGLPLMETLTDAMIVCRGDVQEGGASVYLVKNLEHSAEPTPAR